MMPVVLNRTSKRSSRLHCHSGARILPPSLSSDRRDRAEDSSRKRLKSNWQQGSKKQHVSVLNRSTVFLQHMFLSSPSPISLSIASRECPNAPSTWLLDCNSTVAAAIT